MVETERHHGHIVVEAILGKEKEVLQKRLGKFLNGCVNVFQQHVVQRKLAKKLAGRRLLPQ